MLAVRVWHCTPHPQNCTLLNSYSSGRFQRRKAPLKPTPMAASFARHYGVQDLSQAIIKIRLLYPQLTVKVRKYRYY